MAIATEVGFAAGGKSVMDAAGGVIADAGVEVTSVTCLEVANSRCESGS